MIQIRSLRLFVLLLVLIAFFSCQKRGEASEEAVETTTVKKVQEGEGELLLYENESAKVAPKPAPVWQANMEVLAGQEFLDSGQLELDMELIDSSYYSIRFKTHLPSPSSYPKVWNPQFKKKEKANKLAVTLTGICKGRRFLRTVRKKERSSYEFQIRPVDLSKIASGEETVELTFVGQYESFFGIKSALKPFELKVTLPIYVCEVYKAKLLFNSFILNKERTTEVLSESDPEPEPAFLLKYLGKTMFFQYKKKNRDSFKLYAPKSIDLFYTQKRNEVGMWMMDKDGFLNPNDLICKKEMGIDSLFANEYQKLQFDCVDELKIYAREMGKVN